MWPDPNSTRNQHKIHLNCHYYHYSHFLANVSHLYFPVANVSHLYFPTFFTLAILHRAATFLQLGFFWVDSYHILLQIIVTSFSLLQEEEIK